MGFIFFFLERLIVCFNNKHDVGTHNVNIIVPTPRQQYNYYFRNEIKMSSATNITANCSMTVKIQKPNLVFTEGVKF